MILPTTSKIGKHMFCSWFNWEEKSKPCVFRMCVFRLVRQWEEGKGRGHKTGANAGTWLLENAHEGSNSTTNRKNNNISCSRLHTHSLCRIGWCTSANIGPQTHIITDKHINWSLVVLFVGLVAVGFLLMTKEASSLQSETKSSLWSSRRDIKEKQRFSVLFHH